MSFGKVVDYSHEVFGFHIVWHYPMELSGKLFALLGKVVDDHQWVFSTGITIVLGSSRRFASSGKELENLLFIIDELIRISGARSGGGFSR